MLDSIAQAGQLAVGVPVWWAYVAIAVSGVAGATYAARRGFDVVGVFGIAFSTGLGGLLLRDLLLGNIRENLFTEPWFLVIAFGAAAFGFFFAGLIARFDTPMVILDGLAMGFLCSLGVQAGFLAELPLSSCVFLGFVTAVGGLILRDILAGNAPEVVRPGVFIAIPAIIASIAFALLVQYDVAPSNALIVAMVISLALRAGAYWFGWHTGAAGHVSESVWSFWIRRKPEMKDYVGPLTYTDLLAHTSNDDDNPGKS